MAMPNQHTKWPPPHAKTAFDQIAHDHNWLSGITSTRTSPGAVTSPWQHNGGIGGAIARAVYGRPTQHSGDATARRHLNVPSRLCAASAAMLMGKPPGFELHPDDAENTAADECLTSVTSTDEFAAQLYNAAYTTAGLGWVVGRIVWDTSLEPHPWIEWVDPDRCVIDWRHGRVQQVTFWDLLPKLTKDKKVHRLLQIHTRGRIDYGLYEGTHDEIGRMVPFAEHPDAAYLTTLVDADSGIPTGVDDLTAVVIINSEDATHWRKDPQLRHLGKSDIAAGGDLWRDIDSIYTDLMQEYDAAKAKLLVSEELLESRKPGRGQLFNLDRTVFPVAQVATAEVPPTIEQVQFQIRVNEYLAGLDRLQREAASNVGLSAITVGLDSDTNALTATEVRARSRQTLETWDKKARFWRAGLSKLLTALLQVDAHINGTTPPNRPVNVAMIQPVQDTELDEARTLAELRGAGIASLRYSVRRLHPEWTPEQVDEEVQEIMRENSSPDPFLLGPDVPPVNDA